MNVKDYYKVLEVPETASEQDIKKAYRQLAMKYHPDKNSGNVYADAHFREVQEAYEVLSDQYRRSTYNQQRWYRQSTRKRSNTEPVTPHLVLKKCQELNSYLRTIDTSRINQQALHQYLLHLLRESTVKLLLEWNDAAINNQVITEVLKASSALHYRYMEKVASVLVRLSTNNNEMIHTIHQQVQQRKVLGYWQRYQGLVILLIAIVLCWLIYKIAS